MRRSTLSLLLLLLLQLPTPLRAQSAADAELLAEVNGIKAVDNHAHVLSAAGPDGREDEARTRRGCTSCRAEAPEGVRFLKASRAGVRKN